MINRALYVLPYSLLRPGAGMDHPGAGMDRPGAGMDADPAHYVAAAVDIAVDQAESLDVVDVDCTAPADKAGAAGYTAQVVTVM